MDYQRKLNEDSAELDSKIARLREQKEADTIRLEELKKALQKENEAKAQRDFEIKELFREREAKRNNENQSDAHARTVQFFFEDWFRNIGQFQKKGGKKLAATK